MHGKNKENGHKERCLFIIAVFHLLISTVERNMSSHFDLYLITLRIHIWSNECSNMLEYIVVFCCKYEFSRDIDCF